MAAYAAVVSLVNNMEQIMNHPRLSTCFDKNQIESLGETLDFLLDFVESDFNSHGGISKEEVEDMERQIASAAHAAEDVIESDIVDQIQAGSTEGGSILMLDLEKVIEDLDSVRVKVMEVKEKCGSKAEQPTYSTSAISSRSHLTGSTGESSSIPLLDVQKIIQNMDSIQENVIKIKQIWGLKEEGPPYSKSSSSSTLLTGSTGESSISLIDLLLQKIIQSTDSVKEDFTKVEEKSGFKEDLPTYSSRPHAMGMNNMVGFDGYLVQLLDALTGQQPDLQIIPIVGMGGIGKTTLARNAYQNSVIVQHFKVRAWATVSQKNDLRQILLECLSCLGESTSKLGEKKEAELGDQLQEILFDRRYLIVLDDMWSTESWDKIKYFFPDNYNKSRIIVTTRQSDLVDYFGSMQLAVNFLNEDESWNLFCQKAFAQEDCPLELEEIGRRIVKKLRGLPLSIVVIAGLLGKSSRTPEYWENVAENISSVLNSEEDFQYLNILSLSYSHLPACLKPCFLYMGTLQEDHEIRVSRLIKLWVAEGFLKPISDQSLEAVAEGYLKDLVERNLISVCSLGSNGKFKTCKIHDLLRDLCLWMAEKEKFIGVTRVLYAPQDKTKGRRIIIRGSTAEKYYDPQLFHTLESTPLARTLICESPSLLSFKSRLLRVLIEVYSDSLDATFQQVNLRFLAYESIRAPIGWIRSYKLPSSISLLWNVQTLIIDKSIAKVVAPPEIWKMPQLRHLQFHRISLPDPSDPPPSDEQDDFVLQNLQTLGTVLDFRCSKEVCRRMPNIKKLRIFYDDFSGEGETISWYGLCNAGYFNKLESLYCCFNIVPDRKDLLQNLNFPCSLKKLILQDCELCWSDLTIIGSLPHLEVLKLKCQSVRGREWNPVEGEFLSLKFLEIDSCYLIYWNAESSHFPVLEKLVLGKLYRLNEIPLGIGEIPRLQNVCVVDCSVSAAISAIKILNEQESFGNEGLQVRVKFMEKAKLEEFMEKVKLHGFTSNNFQMDGM